MIDHELYKRLNALTFQLAELDRKVTFLFKHLNVQYVDARPPPDEIERLILAGDRIAALKLYQQKHGANLIDATRAIQEIAARLGV
jgi:hypothetical protein